MSLVVLLALIAAPEVSASPAHGPVLMALDLGASYRVGLTRLTEMRVNADGQDFGQDQLLEHRFSLAPTLSLRDSAKIVSEVQLAAGYLDVTSPAEPFRGFGPARDQSAEAFGEEQQWGDQVHLRKLYLEWRLPIGVIRAGRQTTTWGLGILANGGDDEHMDWGAPRFGSDRNYGDVNDRVLLATAPLAAVSQEEWAKRLTVAIGGDLVVRDERGTRADGDHGVQGLGVVRYKDEVHELGTYIVRRSAADSSDETTDVWVYDLFGSLKQTIADFEVSATGEVALIDGDTTVARNTAVTGELDVQQLGYVARAGLTYVPAKLGLDFELGYASGDSNPNDRFVRSFSFDRDYNPSLILFEELRAAETVASAAAASDPALVGVPSTSVRYLPTGGSVSNAIYVRPTLRYELSLPMLELGVRAAVLWARTEENNVDPFNTNTESRALNFQGGPASARDLGLEVNLGVDVSTKAIDGLELLASVQAGQLYPGDAFADAAGDRPEPISAVFAKLLARFDSAETR